MNIRAESYNTVANVLCIIGNYAEFNPNQKKGVFVTVRRKMDHYSQDPCTWFDHAEEPFMEDVSFDKIDKKDQESIIASIQSLISASHKNDFEEWCMWCRKMANEMDEKMLQLLLPTGIET